MSAIISSSFFELHELELIEVLSICYCGSAPATKKIKILVKFITWFINKNKEFSYPQLQATDVLSTNSQIVSFPCMLAVNEYQPGCMISITPLLYSIQCLYSMFSNLIGFTVPENRLCVEN